MEIKYNVEVPKSDAEDVNALHNFAESDKKTMQITFETPNEASLRRSVLARAIENNEFDMNIKRMGAVVYIEKR